MMELTKEESDVFERRLAMARQQLEEIDRDIERELEEVRERIAALQQQREAPLKMYDAACTMLGIANELAGNGNGSDPSKS
jgi:DNA repair exonuclease SbcCD ATPase subunit